MARNYSNIKTIKISWGTGNPSLYRSSSLAGTYELTINLAPKYTMCVFVAQLVEHRYGNSEVMGSNPELFSGFFASAL